MIAGENGKARSGSLGVWQGCSCAADENMQAVRQSLAGIAPDIRGDGSLEAGHGDLRFEGLKSDNCNEEQSDEAGANAYEPFHDAPPLLAAIMARKGEFVPFCGATVSILSWPLRPAAR